MQSFNKVIDVATAESECRKELEDREEAARETLQHACHYPIAYWWLQRERETREQLAAELDQLRATFNVLVSEERRQRLEKVQLQERAMELKRQGVVPFPVRIAGGLDTKELQEAGMAPERIHALMADVSGLSQQMEDGPPQSGGQGARQRQLNETAVAAIKEKYGEVAARQAQRATVELEHWNPSGFYPTPVLWNEESNQPMTCTDILEFAVAHQNRFLG